MAKTVFDFLQNKPSTILITGAVKTIKGMARFVTKNFPNDEYIKVTFTDKSQLLALASGDVFFAETPLNTAEGIDDRMIGTEKEIVFQGKKFILENAGDYQFCLEVLAGRPHEDIEGECLFSDYMSVNGKSMLSLGWLRFDGRRADVLADMLDPTLVAKT